MRSGDDAHLPVIGRDKANVKMDIGRRGFLGGMVAAVAATADSMPSARPPGFRLLEVADDFSYSWNFVVV